MQFDLFTFVATIVNFLVVVALLRALLYKRIVAAIDNREQAIQDRWTSAEEEKEEAERRQVEFQGKQETFDRQRDELFNRAEEEAEERKNELLEDARQEVKKQKARWLDTLEQEKEHFLGDFRRRAGEELVGVLESILSDMADVDLQEKVVGKAADIVEGLPEDEQEKLRSAIDDADGVVRVRTSHELSPDARTRLEGALGRVMEGTRVQTESAPELIVGIELVTPERRVAWSIRDYLDELTGTLTDNLAKVRGEA